MPPRAPVLAVLLAVCSVAHAIADATEAIKLDPKFGTAYITRGLFYGDKGDAMHALADFKQAVALDPNDQGARANLARAQALLAGHLPAAVPNPPRAP